MMLSDWGLHHEQTAGFISKAELAGLNNHVSDNCVFGKAISQTEARTEGRLMPVTVGRFWKEQYP